MAAQKRSHFFNEMLNLTGLFEVKKYDNGTKAFDLTSPKQKKLWLSFFISFFVDALRVILFLTFFLYWYKSPTDYQRGIGTAWTSFAQSAMIIRLYDERIFWHWYRWESWFEFSAEAMKSAFIYHPTRWTTSFDFLILHVLYELSFLLQQ